MKTTVKNFIYPTFDLLYALPIGAVLTSSYASSVYTWQGFRSDEVYGSVAVVTENGFEETFQPEYFTGHAWSIQYMEADSAKASQWYEVRGVGAVSLRFINLTDAIFMLLAVRQAMPQWFFSLYDADDYLIQRSQIEPIVEAKRNEAAKILALCELYL